MRDISEDNIIAKRLKLDSNEEAMIEYVKSGRKVPSRTFLIPVQKSNDCKQLIDKFSMNIFKDRELRTRYIYKNVTYPYKIIDYRDRYTFPIKDISDRNETAKSVFLKKAAFSESMIPYDPENESLLRIKGYITDEHRIVLLVTLFEIGKYVYDIKSFFLKFLGKTNLSGSAMFSVDIDNKFEEKYRADNQYFWKTVLDINYKLNVPGAKKIDENSVSFKMITSSLEFDDELVQKLDHYSEKYGVSISTILFTCWSELLGRYNEVDELSVALGGHEHNEALYFIRQNRKDSLEKRIRDNSKRIEQTYEFGYCSRELFFNITGQSPENVISSQFFVTKEAYLSSYEFGETLVIDDCIHVECPLYLYVVEDDSHIGINYVFDENTYNEELISSLHQWFSLIVNELFNVSKGDFDKNMFFSNTDSKEEKLYKIMLAQKALYLVNSGVFENCTNTEIMNIAKQCRLINYSQDSEVLGTGYASYGVFLLGDGRIEESRAGFDGVLKTIRILKNNEIFGLECFDSNKLSKSSYYSYGKKASVLVIPFEVMNGYLATHPASWKHILNAAISETDTVKKLWLTV